ncbi:hypothetical protein [Kitasatospora viridis]|uniref:Peptide zinc metalloprotease protein n=1 Tax=Kitasatospora viridis TaxID=281105 RepID=A0A561UQ18_9ACTN|nr:hypothetical protein [Kitasatospora viridis]TWG01472.1 hypothetical protein FHX73_115373 [Kitasatospora viridis]
MTTATTSGRQPGPDARVRLRRLHYRHGSDVWTVGCPETGQAVDLPGIAVTVLRALTDGATLAEAAARAEQEHGVRPDVPDFVATLVTLDFVVQVATAGDLDPDEHQEADAGSSLPWLRPSWARLLFHPVALTGAAAFVLAAFVRLALLHRFRLGYQGYFSVHSAGLSTAWNTAVLVAGVVLHEFCHLAAARAAQVPARLSLGTRLVMVTPQTSAPLLWLADRRTRLRFHLAGAGCDLVLAAGSATVLAQTRPGTLPAELAGSALLMQLSAIAGQFLFCVRTDGYLVVQELLRCRNLYGDALEHARHLAARSRLLCRLDRRVAGYAGRPDPVLALPAHERRPVRLYTVFLLGGAVALIAAALGYALPIAVTLLARGAGEVASGQPAQVVDGLAMLVFEGGAELLLLALLVRGWRRGRAERRRERAAAARFSRPVP